jgi:hypothetical protein
MDHHRAVSSHALEADDDAPLLVMRIDVAMSLDDLLSTESPVDDRLELA